MNLKRIIREEMDNSLGWINDIKPALNEEQNWIIVNDVNPSDIKEGIKIQKYLFDLGYKWFSSEIIMDTIYSIHHFPNKGLRGDLTYYNNKENERDLADKEIERNNNVYYWSQIKPNEINESDDLDWIRDITHQLPMDRDWWLINDIDPNSLEVSKEIQQFLFNQEFAWISGRRKFLPERFWAVSHRGGTYSENSGKFAYHPPRITKKIEQDIKAMEASGEVYYWSQLKSDSLNESNDLDWIKDIEAGDLWTPYVGMKFIVTDGSDDVIYHILDINDEEGWMELKWKNNKTGEEEYFGYYIEDYYRMVEEGRVQIVHDKLNESEGDLDWIKNINPIPELKAGSCFTDVMDPTQRKWVIIDFILTPAGTRTVIVKNNIDIKYMNVEDFEQDLFSGRYKPCQR